MGEEAQENIDPKLKELLERWNQLVIDCDSAGYVLAPYTETGIRISKKQSDILKGFRGFKPPNIRKGWGKK